jgi:uncharacterized protein
MQSRRSVLLIAFLAMLCLQLAVAGAASAQDARAYSESPLPAPEGYVNDYANVIDAATEQKLQAISDALKERANIEFAIATVPTTGGRDIFDYSLSVSRGWGIGSKENEKNGLLLLVATNDRKYQTQVSRHLEGDLPDGLVGEIARQRLVPPFREGNYSKGILDFVQTVSATLADKRGFSMEGIEVGQAYRPSARTPQRTRGRQSQSSLSLGACCLVAVVGLILLSMFSGGGRGRRGGGGGGSGCLNALLLANLFSGLSGGGRSSSGWGGGGGSGWGGGSGGGGGFGGFGGGGDFGGGGAGGSW